MQVHIQEAPQAQEAIRRRILQTGVHQQGALEITRDQTLITVRLADQALAAVAQQGLLLDQAQEVLVAQVVVGLVVLEDQDRKTPHNVVINTLFYPADSKRSFGGVFLCLLSG